MKTIACALALGLTLAAGAAAQTPPGEEDESAKLLAILSEETAVATKTRMNSDFVPGIVTVLNGEELEALGVETAWEALSLVPGIQTALDPRSLPTLVVRGLTFPFNTGNVKVLVNGISLSRESAGINGISLTIPIQEVDRIEVIRGPGSVVYGDFAFMGLVNIITKKRGTHAFARFGGYDALSAGVDHAFATPDGSWHGSISAAALRSNAAEAPEQVRATDRRAFAAATLASGGFSLTAETLARRFDQTGAATGTLFKQNHAAVEGRYAEELAPKLRAEARASYLDDNYDASDGFYGSILGFGVDVTYGGIAGHSILLAASYDLGRIDQAVFSLAPPPPPAPQNPITLVVPNKNREVVGLTLQDQWDISDKLALTGGLRFDRYTDVDHRVTPRLALVYRASSSHVVKLQYAEGFRPPTVFELYGSGRRNPDITFEVNRTAELDYVYRRPKQVGRATLFRSEIHDMIFVVDPMHGVFGNPAHATAFGAELEWEQELLQALKMQANLSWVDAKDNRAVPAYVKTPTPEAKWLWNLALLYHPIPSTVLGARWNHVSNRAIPGTHDVTDLVDLTFTVNDLVARGVSVVCGVKDVFNVIPTTAFEGPFETVLFRFPGRTLFVQLGFGRDR